VPSVARLPETSKRWALLIGVNEYQDKQVGSLFGAANDARALAEALVTHAGFPADQVVMLASDQPEERRPTRVNILRRLSNLASVVPKDGLLLVSFSGHGIERGGKAYLLPSDAQMSDDVSLLEETAISVERMTARIKATGVRQVLALLDACRNEPGGRADAPNPLTEAYTRGFDFAGRNREVEAFAVLYATAVGDRAYEYTEKRLGYFTWAVVEGLRGGAADERGEVTLSSLVSFVQQAVPKRVGVDLGSGRRQRPFAHVEGYRADELVVAVRGAAAASAVTSPPPPSPPSNLPASTRPPHPSRAEARRALMRGSSEDVLRLVSEVLAYNPDDAVALRLRASARWTRGDVEGAKADEAEVLRRIAVPSDAEQFEARCFVLRQSDKADEAIADCTEAIRLDPQFAIAYINRGSAYEMKGDVARSMADYTEAVRINPQYVAGYYVRGLSYHRKGEYDRAVADHTEAIRLNPQFAWAYINRGECYGEKGEYDRAIEDFDEAIRLDPKNELSYLGRGFSYYFKGKYDQAIKDYTEAIRLDPRAFSGYVRRGVAYNDIGDYDRAVADFDEAIRLHPTDAWAYASRGHTYSNKKEYRRALPDLDEAVRLDPKYTWAYEVRAHVHEKLGNKAFAAADRQRAKELGKK